MAAENAAMKNSAPGPNRPSRLDAPCGPEVNPYVRRDSTPRRAVKDIAVRVTLLGILACTVSAAPASAQGAGTVSGKVTGPNGQPLSGVLVAVDSLGISVTTSVSGRYVLQRIPTGPVQIEFKMIGYGARGLTVDVSPSVPVIADVVLDPKPIALGAIVVEGVSRAP